ncbi:immunoglobulin-binding protein 1 [Toxorhynchites rutilus septentrionalis]|uniref:immunoglobulin-binding protein 1 n=1 Tax=Toxorhynchites rutilus septentrionalis TaxID=329112 RepID=UPI00247A2F42|nr:immunoglobulin-binding protein 1 [Toxorhynchites rutilus septentrionalis]
MAEANEIPIDRKLGEIFEEAYNLMDTIEACYDPMNSPGVQANIKKCIGLYEDATRLVSLCGLFSSNETYEEIATENLRYFLLPFFLGQLNLKLCNADRKQIVEMADVYFNDFLRRCENYALCQKPETESAVVARNDTPGDKVQELARMAQERNTKLQKYQEKKELTDQIKLLKVAMKKEHVDDEIKREFYLKLLKSCIMEAHDELASIAQEKQILQYIDVARRNNSSTESHKPTPKGPPPRPLKPIIITRDAAQKAVYGMGYPSLPTMTVADFYEQRVREGIFPDAERMKEINKNSLMNRVYQDNAAELDKEEEEKETLVEQDDEEYLARQRAKDEFKDDHRRGYGNRHNRS